MTMTNNTPYIKSAYLLSGLVGLSLLSTAATAQYPGPSKKHPWYKVYVVAFKQPSSLAQHELLTASAQKQNTPRQRKRPVSINSQSGSAFSHIPMNDPEFTAAVSKLRKHYKIIYQNSWTQPSLSMKNARPVRIVSNARVGSHPLLEGTINLQVSRYIHTQFNLRLNRRAAVNAETTDFSDENMNNDGTYGVILDESRKMRSRQMHYIDHPAFGVLFKVVPIM